MTSNTDWIVQTLIDDENMPADLANLYPAASRIADAAAQFVDKADQAIEKKGLFGRQAEVVAKCVDICQHVVKEGAAISRLLRNPLGSQSELDERRLREQERLRDEASDIVHAEVVQELESDDAARGASDE